MGTRREEVVSFWQKLSSWGRAAYIFALVYVGFFVLSGLVDMYFLVFFSSDRGLIPGEHLIIIGLYLTTLLLALIAKRWGLFLVVLPSFIPIALLWIITYFFLDYSYEVFLRLFSSALY